MIEIYEAIALYGEAHRFQMTGNANSDGELRKITKKYFIYDTRENITNMCHVINNILAGAYMELYKLMSPSRRSRLPQWS